MIVMISLIGIKMAFAQTVIIISNSQDSLAHLTQIRQYLDFLDIRENIYVYLYFTPPSCRQV